MHETMIQIWLIAGWTILHYIWVGVAITGIAWLGRLLLRRASSNLRYLYSVTCYVGLTLSPIVVLMAVVQYTSRETTPPRLMAMVAPQSSIHKTQMGHRRVLPVCVTVTGV